MWKFTCKSIRYLYAIYSTFDICLSAATLISRSTSFSINPMRILYIYIYDVCDARIHRQAAGTHNLILQYSMNSFLAACNFPYKNKYHWTHSAGPARCAIRYANGRVATWTRSTNTYRLGHTNNNLQFVISNMDALKATRAEARGTSERYNNNICTI